MAAGDGVGKRKTVSLEKKNGKKRNIIIYWFGRRCQTRTWHLKEIVGVDAILHIALGRAPGNVAISALLKLLLPPPVHHAETLQSTSIIWDVEIAASASDEWHAAVQHARRGDGHSMRWLRKRDAVPVSHCPYHRQMQIIHTHTHPHAPGDFINRNNNSNYSADGLRQLVDARPVQLCNNVNMCLLHIRSELSDRNPHHTASANTFHSHHHWCIDCNCNWTPYLWSWNGNAFRILDSRENESINVAKKMLHARANCR